MRKTENRVKRMKEVLKEQRDFERRFGKHNINFDTDLDTYEKTILLENLGIKVIDIEDMPKYLKRYCKEVYSKYEIKKYGLFGIVEDKNYHLFNIFTGKFRLNLKSQIETSFYGKTPIYKCQEELAMFKNYDWYFFRYKNVFYSLNYLGIFLEEIEKGEDNE